MQDLHIIESESESESSQRTDTDDAGVDVDAEPAPSPFESAGESPAGPGDIDSVASAVDGRREFRQVRRFLDAVADELEKPSPWRASRLVDDLDPGATDDVEFGALLAFEDGSVLFVGSDPTTTEQTVPLFAFVVERYQPIPQPTTCREALDLLRPADVQDAFARDAAPDRQGEWWLLPTSKMPVGTRFEPGVSEQPYGPSPLGSHVPREYGFAVDDDTFMSRVRERVGLPESVRTPPEVINWVHRQRRRTPTPDNVPEWGFIRDVGEEIFVRGTLRHRDRDHYVEKLGEQWHEAQTHQMDVYTGDDLIDRVVLD